MTQATISADWYSGLEIPSILRWWDGSAWTTVCEAPSEIIDSTRASAEVPIHVGPPPARVPELVRLGAEPPPCGGIAIGDRDIGEELAQLRRALEVTERNQLRAELAELRRQIARSNQERDRLRAELIDLNDQIPRANHERNELLASLTPLRTKITGLRARQQVLKSEILKLQREKGHAAQSAVVRRSTEKAGRIGTNQRFHDS